MQAAIKATAYAWTYRNRGFLLPVPTLDLDDPTTFQLWISGDFDSSLGNTGPQVADAAGGPGAKKRLEADGFARMGICLFAAVGKFRSPEEANRAAWCFHSRSCMNVTVSVGTTEAELTTCSWLSRELVGMLNFSLESVSWLQIRTPTGFGDNTGANLIAAGAASARAVRHLCLQRLYCRWVAKQGLLTVREKRSAEMTADLLTKVLPESVILELLRLLNIVEQ